MKVILGLGVIFCWGAGAYLTKFAAQRMGMQVLMWRLLLEMGIGFAYLGATGVLSRVHFDRATLAVALIAGALGTIAMVGYYFLLDRYQASWTVPFTSLYPLVTVALSVAFLREKLTPAQWVGAFMAVAAIMLLGSGRS